MTARPLAGQSALVTGGGAGIGRATAAALAAAGADVGIVDLDPAPAAAVAEALAAEHGVRTASAPGDVALEDAARAAHGAIAAALGPITVLINNAGIMAQEVRPFHEQPIAHVRPHAGDPSARQRAVQRARVPGMRQAGFGRIVNLSSVLGLVGLPYRAGYGVAKTAINGLTRALAMENARFGITVNAIAPGYIATETNLERGRQGLLELRPLRRAHAGRPLGPPRGDRPRDHLPGRPGLILHHRRDHPGRRRLHRARRPGRGHRPRPA